MNFSYWEQKTWMHDIDIAIIGSGMVGLSCALSLKDRFPKKKIVVFEKGMLPSGASTKNAGFACFGSISEIMDDLNSHSEEEVVTLIKERVNGLALLRNQLGDSAIDLQYHGGYELFTLDDSDLYENCLDNVNYVNDLLKEVFLDENDVFSIRNDPFTFKNIQNQLIFNRLEGQLDTGKMMLSFIQQCSIKGIFILNNAEIKSFSSKNDEISLILNDTQEILVKQLAIATNGFARKLLSESVQPARAQVLVTQPIPELKLKGTFHLDKGYYYFRNINDRILFGGGRNLDFSAEETSDFGLTSRIQEHLEYLLRTTILPETPFEIDTRWSGIMGVGSQKKPIVKKVQPHVFCGVRLGGMGVAIGSSIGQQLAALIESE